ncbi:hypothetical protein LA080_002426 [Diaporthe eres]|nr:hypothetical protein LA080_002426 [Diaporthe eres]
MFLFAKLIIETLIAQPTTHDLQREIQPQCFPSGLEQAYKRTIASIQNNPRERERDLANRILSMMLSDRRPLRWHEVQCAISIDPVQQKADWTRTLKFHVRDVCCSLVQILGEDRIQFGHATAISLQRDLSRGLTTVGRHGFPAPCCCSLLFHAMENFSRQSEESLATSQPMTHGTAPDGIADLPSIEDAAVSSHLDHNKGFDPARRCEQHNDHHERRFRCPEDDCPAQIFKFISQKELDKYQKKIHRGATNGPARFARLKKAKIDGDESNSLRCALCHQHFSR